MTLDEFRTYFESYRRSADREAREQKDSFRVLEKLRALYESFDPSMRAMARFVLSEWALSEDESVRFDALALIDELKVVTAMTALEALASRLQTCDTPGAPYELNKVQRIVKHLSQSRESPSDLSTEP